MTTSGWRLDWPTAHGSRLGHAVLKARPGHFFVDEQLAMEDSQVSLQPVTAGAPAPDTAISAVPGTGEHLYLRLEKVGDNTEYVARELARLSGCRPHDVGLSGLKDRHAVTRQWFSVYRPGMAAGDEEYLARVAGQWTLLAAHRGSRKLRRGEHLSNRFVITLTRVCGDRALIEQGLQGVLANGCPNYFGAQRFGHGGNNLQQAIRLNPGSRRGKNPRAGLYFSAARSWLFNEVLARRVEEGSWAQPMAGEPGPEVTGPLWGDGGTEATDSQEVLERGVVAEHPEIAAVFSRTRMKPERRSLVLRPENFRWEWSGENELTLDFALAPGQFATSVLTELFTLSDASGHSVTAEESLAGDQP